MQLVRGTNTTRACVQCMRFAGLRGYLVKLANRRTVLQLPTYYNDDMANLDVGIGLPVSRALPGKDKDRADEGPEGTYAS